MFLLSYFTLWLFTVISSLQSCSAVPGLDYRPFPPPPLEEGRIHRPDSPLEAVRRRPLAHSWSKSFTRVSPPRHTSLCSLNPYFLTLELNDLKPYIESL